MDVKQSARYNVVMRLPDTYYTQQVLDGNTPYYGVNAQPPEYYQGEDIKLGFYLAVDNLPVTPKDYNILGTLKSSEFSDECHYTATINNLGLLADDIKGNYTLFVPSGVTTILSPGTYYFQIQLTERTGDYPKAKTFVALKATVNISRSNFSPASDTRESPQQSSPPYVVDPRFD